MPAERGHLVLADISGYTAFVAETELEHSREILNELLETAVRCLGKHLTIGQIEGDAVFALGASLPADPMAFLEDCFFRFHRHLATIARVTTCPCRACANVGVLTLKFVCHYGEWMPQRFANKDTYVGAAVNAVHRLLKNSVPSREYVLATRDTLDQLPAALRSRFRAHRERYELGEVECGWVDLAPLRADPRAREDVRAVDDAGAEVRSETVLDAPKDRVWAVLTDPEARQRWMGVQRIDYRPGARHTLVGGEYHCIHGSGEATVFRIAEAVEPDRLTLAVPIMGIVVWGTVQLEDAGPGRTRMVSRYRFDRPAGLAGGLRKMLIKRMTAGDFARKYPNAVAAEVARRA